MLGWQTHTISPSLCSPRDRTQGFVRVYWGFYYLSPLTVADYLRKVRVPVTDCLVMDCKVKSAWGSLYPDVTLFYLNRKVPFWHCCSGVRLEVSGLMLIYPGQWLDKCLFPLNMGCVRAGVRKQVGSHLENRSGVCEGSRKRAVKEFLIGLFLFSFLLTRFGRWRERPRLEVAMNKSSHCACD